RKCYSMKPARFARHGSGLVLGRLFSSLMENKPSKDPLPLAAELRDICQTLTGLQQPNNQLSARLQFVAELIADAKSLPPVPILLWRDLDNSSVCHAVLGRELEAGRNPDQSGLALAGDKLLSRRHFIIRAEGSQFWVEDLGSHNGTAVNAPENLIQRLLLRNGDLVLAGSHVFVFLDHVERVKHNVTFSLPG